METQIVKLIKIRDPFNRMDRDYEVVPYLNESLFNLRNNYFSQEEEIIVSINGKVVRMMNCH